MRLFRPHRVGWVYLALSLAAAAGAVGIVWRYQLSVPATIVALLSTVGASYLAWATFCAAHPPPVDSHQFIKQVADQLASAVGTQWENEAKHRRLNDPRPLSVAWRPADLDLVEPWEDLRATALGWPGGLLTDPAGWPASRPAGWSSSGTPAPARPCSSSASSKSCSPAAARATQSRSWFPWPAGIHSSRICPLGWPTAWPWTTVDSPIPPHPSSTRSAGRGRCWTSGCSYRSSTGWTNSPRPLGAAPSSASTSGCLQAKGWCWPAAPRLPEGGHPQRPRCRATGAPVGGGRDQTAPPGP